MVEGLALVDIAWSAEGPVDVLLVDDTCRRHHTAAIQGVLAPIARRLAAANQQQAGYQELSHGSPIITASAFQVKSLATLLRGPS
jgi:hypothetical protein